MLKKDQDKRLLNLLLLVNNTSLVFNFGTELLKFLSNIDELVAILPPEEAEKLKNIDWRSVDETLEWAKSSGHHIITIDHNDYPPQLKEIANPPVMLFAIGDISLLKAPQIAIVGSRNPTPIGLETAHSFASYLAKTGLVVTSGFAAGIDAASHRGTIKSQGQTIAVMGTGLNRVYPAYHAKLAEDIAAANGLLLSEFPLNATAKSWHFPLRNRIISGLSLGTLVVEATLRSGSLITARLAGEQGREVFAIPGSIYNQASRGCHALIRQGAKLVEDPSDILEEFPEFAPLNNFDCQEKNNKIKNKLDREHKKLLDCVGFEITNVDILAARVNLPVSRVNIMLLELELQGLVKRMINGYSRAEQI
jgi:DNA processing protein